MRPRKCRTGARRTADLERERRQVVALVDDDEPVGAEERFQVVDRLEALDHRQVDDAGALASAAAALADLLRGRGRAAPGVGSRHCSSSGLLWARISVGSFRSAISAQAITVLPLPGGATSTPLVVCEHRRDRRLLLRRQLAVELERQRLGCRSPILDHEPAPGALRPRPRAGRAGRAEGAGASGLPRSSGSAAASGGSRAAAAAARRRAGCAARRDA